MEYNLKPDEKATLQLRGLYEEYGYQKYKMGKFEEYSAVRRRTGTFWRATRC